MAKVAVEAAAAAWLCRTAWPPTSAWLWWTQPVAHGLRHRVPRRRGEHRPPEPLGELGGSLDGPFGTLEDAERRNPGAWVPHSINVAKAARIFAEALGSIDPESAYICGLLHDIGRREGVSAAGARPA